jgi:hypothetical protein
VVRFFRAGLNHVRDSRVHSPKARTTADCTACQEALAELRRAQAAGEHPKALRW